MTDFLKGFHCAFAGFSWILHPNIRRFVYIPLIVNSLLFALAIMILSKYANHWVAGWMGEKTDWWSMFQWAYDIISPLLTWLLYVALLLVSYISFSSLANLIAAPFNALLSKAVEMRLSDKTITYDELPLAKEVIITLKTEFNKLIRFLIFAGLLLLILLIPVINVIFPIVWFVFMAYTLSWQYIDYPMSNHGLTYQTQKKILRKNHWQRLGFGTAANLIVLIPILNFIAIPVCVCGATLWWQKHLQQGNQLGN